MIYILQINCHDKRYFSVVVAKNPKTNVHSNVHNHAASLLLLEQSMMGSDSSASGNMDAREETEMEKEMGSGGWG